MTDRKTQDCWRRAGREFARQERDGDGTDISSDTPAEFHPPGETRGLNGDLAG